VDNFKAFRPEVLSQLSLTAGWPEDLKQTVTSCLSYDPEERPTISKALDCEFFMKCFPMRKSTAPYDIDEKLSDGTDGCTQVFRCHSKDKIYAMKMVNLVSKTPENRKKAEYEVEVLKLMKGLPHFIQLYDSFYAGHVLHMILDYANEGDLEKYIIKRKDLGKPLTVDEQDYVLYSILYPVNEMHKRKAIHRDIFPKNILIQSEEKDCCKVKNVLLSDFRMTKLLESGQKTQTKVGSYMSPELVEGKAYTFSTDIWSVGMVIFYMLYGLHADNYKSFQDFKSKGTPISYPAVSHPISDKAVKVMKVCLQKDESKRPKVDKLLSVFKHLAGK
jgi:NIMA (never in mitosis gene a)-related kinase